MKITKGKTRPMERAHIEFNEQMCRTWPIAIKMHEAQLENDYEGIQKLLKEQEPFIEAAHKALTECVRQRRYYHLSYTNDPRFKDLCDGWSKDDPVFWINTFAWAFDPRLPGMGIPEKKLHFPSRLPLVLWPAQEELVYGIETCYRTRTNWLAEKTRGVGLTWIVCAYYVYKLFYQKGFVGGIGSRDKDAVDTMGDLGTIFPKLRHIVYMCPLNMRSPAFEKKDGPNDNKMRLLNPPMESSIIGEEGDNIGRGARTSMYVVDEKAFVEHQELVDMNLSHTTYCQGDVSTPNGMNHFGQKRFSNKVKVFSIHWYQDPSKYLSWRKNQRPSNPEERASWYRLQKMKFDDVTIAQEVDIDYNASVRGSFIPAEWVKAAVNFEIEPQPYFDRAAGFDIAGEGENESAYAMRVGPIVKPLMISSFKSPVQSLWQVVDRGEEDQIDLLNYDMDGIGQSILGFLKDSGRPIKFKTNGLHSNDPASDRYIEREGKNANKKFRNKRAELWWNLRERFQKTWEHVNNVKFYPAEELVCIPDDPDLISQISAPLLKYTSGGGKILCESKHEMRTRGVKSPDRADAVVYAFADYDGSAHVVNEFDYSSSKTHYCDFPVDHSRAGGEQYVSLYQSPGLAAHVVCCWWWGNRGTPLLQVYGEFVEQNALPATVVANVREIVQESQKRIKEWIGNQEMFDGMEEGRMSPWHLYRKAGVKLHRNYSDDWVGSIMLVNKMFASNMIQIHTDCESLMFQLSNWIKHGGKPSPDMGLAMALCQVVTRLKQKKLLPIQKLEFKGYRGGASFGDTSEVNERSFENLMKAKREAMKAKQKAAMA